jgi:acetylornithine deacetylase/succinyl-diaminopimelate desuccinylase family protein
MTDHDNSLRGVILAAIDDQQPAMTAMLAELVSIPSENPPGAAYDASVDALARAMTSVGLKPERVEIAAARPRAAIRAFVGDAAPTLYLHGHYDVVPAYSPDQFTPRIEGGTLFGRGSSDMKSGLVAMLFAARALKSASRRMTGRLGLLFVPDEETGGAGGSAALAQAGELARGGIGMLLPEPTSGRIWNSSRGAFTAEVTVRGRAAHVGMQQYGVNAVEKALPILDRLFALKRELDARGSILLVGGRVDAGANFNVVPDVCLFTVDRRTNPDEDLEAEKRRLLELIDPQAAGGRETSVTVIQEGESSCSDMDQPLGRTLADAVTVVTGEPPVAEMCPGLLETRFYAARGVPAYAYGPGLLSVSHGPNEFVKIDRMVECAKIYALVAAAMLGADS